MSAIKPDAKKIVDQVRFSTDDSAMPIIINFPRPMSKADLDDFEQFIALFIKTQSRISEQYAAKLLEMEDGG